MTAKLVPLRRISGDITEMSDEALLAACGTGDAPALGALFDRFHQAVYRFASRLAMTDELARREAALRSRGRQLSDPVHVRNVRHRAQTLELRARRIEFELRAVLVTERSAGKSGQRPYASQVMTCLPVPLPKSGSSEPFAFKRATAKFEVLSDSTVEPTSTILPRMFS